MFRWWHTRATITRIQSNFRNSPMKSLVYLPLAAALIAFVSSAETTEARHFWQTYGSVTSDGACGCTWNVQTRTISCRDTATRADTICSAPASEAVPVRRPRSDAIRIILATARITVRGITTEETIFTAATAAVGLSATAVAAARRLTADPGCTAADVAAGLVVAEARGAADAVCQWLT